MELLADGTDATATGLLLAEFLVEDGLELVELFAAGLVGADVEAVEFALMLKDVGLEHLV